MFQVNSSLISPSWPPQMNTFWCLKQCISALTCPSVQTPPQSAPVGKCTTNKDQIGSQNVFLQTDKLQDPVFTSIQKLIFIEFGCDNILTDRFQSASFKALPVGHQITNLIFCDQTSTNTALLLIIPVKQDHPCLVRVECSLALLFRWMEGCADRTDIIKGKRIFV